MVFTVDLTEINQDKLEVSLEVPKLRMDTLIYSFPAIIPGHYNQVNYGRFIDSLSAFDKAGRMMEVELQNTNQWLIPDASKLNRITYFVNDTEDADVEALVYPWAATNFRKDELFILNNGGLFGYFEGMEDLSYLVQMHIPEMLHPSSSLAMNKLENSWVDLTSPGYFDLIDCPVILAKADTASFYLDQTKVTISCANEANVSVAPYLSSMIREHLSAVQKFAQRELPVSEYTYLINLRDYSDYSDYVYNRPLSLDLFMKMSWHGGSCRFRPWQLPLLLCRRCRRQARSPAGLCTCQRG